jgi:hypothetical protein
MNGWQALVACVALITAFLAFVMIFDYRKAVAGLKSEDKKPAGQDRHVTAQPPEGIAEKTERESKL